MFDFQPKGKTWEERSFLEGDKAVLDPAGSELKNCLIDTLQKEALNEAINQFIHSKDTCLDFGCGVGRLYNFLQRNFCSYQGVDITSSMIDQAKLMYAGNFYVYDGLNLPIQNQSIDVIISVLVLQHINDVNEYEKIVQEFYRVVKHDGYIVFIEQVDKEKSKGSYINPFESNGFILKSLKLVRRGRSISSYISSRKWCKLLSINIMLKILLYMTKIENIFPPLKSSYEECIFVFRRERGIEM